MGSVIYYFSGTGNSLAIAMDLAGELKAELSAISSFEQEDVVSANADIVGIVYPVYALGLPLIVGRFLNKLDLSPGTYVFIVANYAKIQGAGITKAYRLLRRKGIKPQAGFGIVMPNNYTPFGGAVALEKQKLLIESAKKTISKIAQIVRNKERVPVRTGFFLARWVFAELICKLSALVTSREDKNFFVTEKCDGCGICQRICPVENIKMSEKKPIWNHKCELCFACLQWCPREAIEFGRSTLGKKRYRHPDAKIENFLR